jgi:hypothetical protein
VAYAIDFDRKACVGAEEVEDVRVFRMLATKLQAGKSPAAELLPQQNLRQRHFSPQCAGALQGQN